MDPLRLRFIVPGLVLLALDVASVGLPLVALFQQDFEVLGQILRAALPIASVLLVGWAFAMGRWLHPVWEARARRRTARAPEASLDAAARHAILALPDRALRLRAAIWAAVGLGTVVALRLTSSMAAADLVVIGSVFSVNTLCPTVFRAWFYEGMLARPLADLGPIDDPFELLRGGVVGRLRRVAFATGALGVAAVLLFVQAFIPVTLEQFRGLQMYFPLTIIALIAVWQPVRRAIVRPVETYLAATDEAARAGLAAAAYRTAEALPYTLAGLKAAFWLVGEALLLAQSVLLFAFDLERAVLVAATAFFMMIGVAIYESILHRQTLRPLLASIVRRDRRLVREVRPLLTLRGKMLLAFGGLALFVCGFSLYWSFVQYRRLAQSFIEMQAAREVANLTEGLRDLAGLGPIRRDAVDRYLREQVGELADMEAVIYHLPEKGRQLGVAASGAAPPLPRSIVESVRRRRQDWLDASAIRMQGAFAPVSPGRAELGTLVVLLPGYRVRGPGLERNLRVLVVFFVLLFATASGIVGLVAGDLTGPVKTLERRAEAMARGDLASVVPVGPEPDELGRLALAFEEMRAALDEKIFALEELQASLEHKVIDRTRDLARSNEELRQALDALRMAQTKLVASGKMAIVGQLLAGVAHEINNPVNAIVNSVEPLEETTRRLLARHPDAAAVADKGEIEQMLRVIRSGAERTKRIVQALRNYARGDGEELQEFDVHRGLDEALELLRHQLKHGIAVERRYAADGKLRGYPGQLNQVFLNLLTNAAQALAGREDGRIEIETRHAAGAVDVIVRDNGQGIPPEVVPRIFDPFFTTKPVGQGTGLGLSICQQIVERHGGTIRVETRAGEGTAFVVTLP
ncbi:MAG: ATP-binding protein, partial [Myxococcota bacterium]